MTENQKDLIARILNNEYQGSAHPSRCDVWTWSVTEGLGASAGGIISQAHQAGLVFAFVDRNQDDSTIRVTQKGLDEFLAAGGVLPQWMAKALAEGWE